MPKLTPQARIAAGLGISQSQCSRLMRRGMPITSLRAARAWRRRNVDGTRGRVKGTDPAPGRADLENRLLAATVKIKERAAQIDGGAMVPAGELETACLHYTFQHRARLTGATDGLLGGLITKLGDSEVKRLGLADLVCEWGEGVQAACVDSLVAELAKPFPRFARSLHARLITLQRGNFPDTAAPNETPFPEATP